MSEEQFDTDVEQNEVVEQEVEDESGTATDEEAQQVEQQEQEQPDYQKIIAEKAYEARQAKREREELQKQLEQIQANAPKDARPNVPPVPDPFDDDYERKIQERDEALRNAAAFDAQERIKQQQAHDAEQARLQQEQQKLQTRVTEYSKRAAALGVDSNELAQAGQRLQGMVTDDVASYILDNESGPLMTKYLAANPLELDTLSTLNPMQAAVYLETKVRAKAEQFGQKRVTNAPEPVETLNGVAPSQHDGPSAGGTFS